MANGIVGLKPSYGRVSRYGVMELAGSLDHVGPMTRTVKDSALLFEVLAGRDTNDPSSLDDAVPDIAASLDGEVRGLRLGVDKGYYSAGTDPGLVQAIEEVISTLDKLGVRLVPVSMPEADPLALRNLWLPITAYEAVRAHAETFPSRAAEYGPYLRGVLELGLGMSEADYAAVTAQRSRFNEQFEEELAKVDAVICPAGGFVFEADQQAQYGDADAMREVVRHFQGQFTIPADLAGTPALIMPCGFADDGRPYAVQLLGSRLSELRLCRLGHAYQQLTDWHTRHPDL
jgi:amidase